MPRPAPLLTQKTASVALKRMGQQIRDYRKKLELSQVETAEAAGMSRPTLSRIEKGNPSVTVGSVVTAAAVLGLEFRLLVPSTIGGDGDEELPSHIYLDEYPSLRKAAWHMPGAEAVTPEEAFQIYDRNWDYIDRESLNSRERLMIRRLFGRFGRGIHGV